MYGLQSRQWNQNNRTYSGVRMMQADAVTYRGPIASERSCKIPLCHMPLALFKQIVSERCGDTPLEKEFLRLGINQIDDRQDNGKQAIRLTQQSGQQVSWWQLPIRLFLQPNPEGFDAIQRIEQLLTFDKQPSQLRLGRLDTGSRVRRKRYMIVRSLSHCKQIFRL